MQNKIIILAFVVASLLVGLAPEREVFPIFDWGLFARIPQQFIYHSFLVTNKECKMNRTPFWTSIQGKKRMYLLREYPGWKKDLFHTISETCRSHTEITIEDVDVLAETLPLWKRGIWSKVKESHAIYHSL